MCAVPDFGMLVVLQGTQVNNIVWHGLGAVLQLFLVNTSTSRKYQRLLPCHPCVSRDGFM